MKEALAPSELVERVRMVGEMVAEETMGLVEEGAMEALVVALLGEAMVEDVNWCRRHSHLQDTSLHHRVLGQGQWMGQGQ